MATFTISLPDAIAKLIDREAANRGFATRSEFFRDLVRKYFISQVDLEPFTKLPLTQIETELVKTKKYSPTFIKSLISGLKKSSVYADKTTAA